MRIESLMTRAPVTCRPDNTLREAAMRMWKNDCGCLPVTSDDRSQRLVGMITDRDICVAARFPGRNLDELLVGDAMAKEIRACNPEDGLEEAGAIMQEARVRRLPVVGESERLVGILSLADLAREAARHGGSKEAEITMAEIGELLAALCEPLGIEGKTWPMEPREPSFRRVRPGTSH